MAMIQCKECNKEMSSSAKSCPACGAKNKKPVYKRVWFWILIVFIGIPTLTSVINGGLNTTETNAPSSASSAASSAFSESSSKPAPATATVGQKNALAKAKQYLSVMAYSYDGLIKQLEYEKFSHEDSVYGADNCGADWNEQAAKKAKNYLDIMAYSRDGLIEQLEYEGFTNEQAVCGVEANGY